MDKISNVKLGYILPNTDKYGDGRQKQTARPAGIVSLHCNRKRKALTLGSYMVQTNLNQSLKWEKSIINVTIR